MKKSELKEYIVNIEADLNEAKNDLDNANAAIKNLSTLRDSARAETCRLQNEVASLKQEAFEGFQKTPIAEALNARALQSDAIAFEYVRENFVLREHIKELEKTDAPISS